MKTRHQSNPCGFGAALTAALMSVTLNASAETYPFRVVYEDVPGVAEITAGDVDAGIGILRAMLADGSADRGYVLASLCGALIVASSLDEAAEVCAQAIETHRGEAAYNNRGVLRVFNGDYRGAEDDFNRARPQHLQAYMEQLRATDTGLVANGNFGLLERLAANHPSSDTQSSVAAARGAEIKNPIGD